MFGIANDPPNQGALCRHYRLLGADNAVASFRLEGHRTHQRIGSVYASPLGVLCTVLPLAGERHMRRLGAESSPNSPRVHEVGMRLLVVAGIQLVLRLKSMVVGHNVWEAAVRCMLWSAVFSFGDLDRSSLRDRPTTGGAQGSFPLFQILTIDPLSLEKMRYRYHRPPKLCHLAAELSFSQRPLGPRVFGPCHRSRTCVREAGAVRLQESNVGHLPVSPKTPFAQLVGSFHHAVCRSFCCGYVAAARGMIRRGNWLGTGLEIELI